MEESRKGAAVNSGTKATSASLDEYFGKDFPTSWNSTKFGNDVMDFDVETSEGKGKGKKFNFGKLDDFDLDADFDKLPSFKMDMSDLDFSSPVKKNNSNPCTGKSYKDSSHGKDEEKESFSFSFNFDDLGKFDLDSHLTIKKKEAPQLEPSTSVELGLNNTQKGDLPAEIMDTPKIDSSKAPSKPEASSSTSRPPSSEKQPSKLPSCDLSNGSDQLARRRFSVSSISGNSNDREAHVAQSHSVKKNSDHKTDNCAQSSESHPQLMRSASPVTSINNQDCVSGDCSSDRGLSKNKDSTTLSTQNESNRNLVAVKEVQSEKSINSTDTISATQRLASKTKIAITSATHRHLELNARQEKVTSLLYKPQPISALSSEQSGDPNMRKKLPNYNSQDMERHSDVDSAPAKNSLVTATEKTSKLRASVGSGKPEIENNTLSTQNTNGFLPTDNASLKSEKQKFMPNPLTSRFTTMKLVSPSETPENDLRSAKLREINKVPLQLPAPNLASKRKPALFSPPLKRKVIEDDLFTPLKRISSSPAEARNSPKIDLKPICSIPLESRNSTEITFNPEDELVTRIEGAEAFKDNLKSPDFATETVLGTADFEIPVSVLENNGNVASAETISKELGDINSMLKKKQEEAKELLVRAIVSNNKLLMLNHPLYAEKLSSLERFASMLRAKHF